MKRSWRAGLPGLLVVAGLAGAGATEDLLPSEISLTTAITRRANLEGRVVWMDGTANLKRLSTPDGVAEVLQRCREANINTVVVDVKPLSGHVLYNSRIGPRLKSWRGFDYPPDHDLLLHAMLEGRRRGIRVYAGLNVFCEGHKLIREGKLYQDPASQCVVYDVERTLRAPDGETFRLVVGENTGPQAAGISVWSPSAPDGRLLGTDDAAAIVEDGRVSALVDGALLDQARLRPPPNGYVLIGRGAGAKWLLAHLEVGATPAYTAREVLEPILSAPSELVGAFVNPADPAARAYALSIVQELANNYAIDGIVLDRMRHASLRTDFSPLSRAAFEEWLGAPIARFPQDIYEYDPVPGRPLIQGPHYRKWLEWRASLISSWLDEARKVVARSRPSMALAAYVGSWYDRYYPVGVNWAADDYRPGFPWMTDGYAAAGYARKVSWLTTGCYYRLPTRDDARQLGESTEETIEAAAEMSERAANDATFVYAGVNLLDYKDRPEDFRRALRTAVERSQGVMLFDLVYLEDYNWWHILSEAFPSQRRAPHDVAGLQSAIQQARQALANVPPRPASPP